MFLASGKWTYMRWLKKNWFRIVRFIGIAFILYLCGLIAYAWLEYNGSVWMKLVSLPLFLSLIWVFTADFHDRIIDKIFASFTKGMYNKKTGELFNPDDWKKPEQY